MSEKEGVSSISSSSEANYRELTKRLGPAADILIASMETVVYAAKTAGLATRAYIEIIERVASLPPEVLDEPMDEEDVRVAEVLSCSLSRVSEELSRFDPAIRGWARELGELVEQARVAADKL